MHLDPLAGLKCWSVDVDIGDRTYSVPAQPAAVWLLPILNGSWTDIVPGLLDDPGDLADLILDGTVTYEQVRDAARDALAAAAGMKWWIAAQLAHAVAGSWVAAELALHGVDPDRVSLGAWLAAAHRTATREMDKADRARFEFDLERPPEGVAPEEWFDEDEAAAGFVALMGTSAGGLEE